VVDVEHVTDTAPDGDAGVGVPDEGAGDSAGPPEISGSYVEMEWHTSFPPDAESVPASGRVVRSSSQATAADMQDTFQQMLDGAVDAVQTAVDRARDHWQHGQCVQLQVDAPKTVKPSSTSTISVAVSHVDEGPLALPVSGTLVSGGESLDPSSDDGPSAEFRYTAPDEAGETATLQFEVRSRRGADQKSVGVQVTKPALVASTVSGQISISGTVSDIDAPFTLEGEFQGGSATLVFSPTSDQGGTMSYSGGGSGVTVSGDGSYTLVDDGDGSYTLRYTSQGCTSLNTCREQSAVISLDPVA
jgi:hypothetical protein